MLRLSQEIALVAVFRMKKNKMNYRVADYADGHLVKRERTIHALYQQRVRKAWQKLP